MRISDWSSDVCSSDLTNVYEAVSAHISDLRKAGKRVILASYTKGSRERMQGLLADHGLKRTVLADRSEEHTSELQSLMRISYAVFCLKKKNKETSEQHESTGNGHETERTQIGQPQQPAKTHTALH